MRLSDGNPAAWRRRMAPWSWPWISPTMVTVWSARGSTWMQFGSRWRRFEAVSTSFWTTEKGRTSGSCWGGRLREDQSSMLEKSATHSRVKMSSLGQQTGLLGEHSRAGTVWQACSTSDESKVWSAGNDSVAGGSRGQIGPFLESLWHSPAGSNLQFICVKSKRCQ